MKNSNSNKKEKESNSNSNNKFSIENINSITNTGSDKKVKNFLEISPNSNDFLGNNINTEYTSLQEQKANSPIKNNNENNNSNNNNRNNFSLSLINNLELNEASPFKSSLIQRPNKTNISSGTNSELNSPSKPLSEVSCSSPAKSNHNSNSIKLISSHNKRNDPKNRRFFYYKEQLNYQEDAKVEYKEYLIPYLDLFKKNATKENINNNNNNYNNNNYNNNNYNYNKSNNSSQDSKDLQNELKSAPHQQNRKYNEEAKVEIIKKTICAFLNSDGGRIYFGITDTCVVNGIKLALWEKDRYKCYFRDITRCFWPQCYLDRISVFYVPLKCKDTGKFIKDLYVVKLKVLKGKPDFLYSVSQFNYVSFIRVDNQVCLLKSEFVHDEIRNRVRFADKLPENEENEVEPEIPDEDYKNFVLARNMANNNFSYGNYNSHNNGNYNGNYNGNSDNGSFLGRKQYRKYSDDNWRNRYNRNKEDYQENNNNANNANNSYRSYNGYNRNNDYNSRNQNHFDSKSISNNKNYNRNVQRDDHYNKNYNQNKANNDIKDKYGNPNNSNNEFNNWGTNTLAASRPNSSDSTDITNPWPSPVLENNNSNNNNCLLANTEIPLITSPAKISNEIKFNNIPVPNLNSTKYINNNNLNCNKKNALIDSNEKSFMQFTAFHQQINALSIHQQNNFLNGSLENINNLTFNENQTILAQECINKFNNNNQSPNSKHMKANNKNSNSLSNLSKINTWVTSSAKKRFTFDKDSFPENPDTNFDKNNDLNVNNNSCSSNNNILDWSKCSNSNAPENRNLNNLNWEGNNVIFNYMNKESPEFPISKRFKSNDLTEEQGEAKEHAEDSDSSSNNFLNQNFLQLKEKQNKRKKSKANLIKNLKTKPEKGANENKTNKSSKNNENNFNCNSNQNPEKKTRFKVFDKNLFSSKESKSSTSNKSVDSLSSLKENKNSQQQSSSNLSSNNSSAISFGSNLHDFIYKKNAYCNKLNNTDNYNNNDLNSFSNAPFKEKKICGSPILSCPWDENNQIGQGDETQSENGEFKLIKSNNIKSFKNSKNQMHRNQKEIKDKSFYELLKETGNFNIRDEEEKANSKENQAISNAKINKAFGHENNLNNLKSILLSDDNIIEARSIKSFKIDKSKNLNKTAASPKTAYINNTANNFQKLINPENSKKSSSRNSDFNFDYSEQMLALDEKENAINLNSDSEEEEEKEKNESELSSTNNNDKNNKKKKDKSNNNENNSNKKAKPTRIQKEDKELVIELIPNYSSNSNDSSGNECAMSNEIDFNCSNRKNKQSKKLNGCLSGNLNSYKSLTNNFLSCNYNFGNKNKNKDNTDSRYNSKIKNPKKNYFYFELSQKNQIKNAAKSVIVESPKAKKAKKIKNKSDKKSKKKDSVVSLLEVESIQENKIFLLIRNFPINLTEHEFGEFLDEIDLDYMKIVYTKLIQDKDYNCSIGKLVFNEDEEEYVSKLFGKIENKKFKNKKLKVEVN